MINPFEGAGSLRDAYDRVDWAATSLGPVRTWSPTLLATVSMALKSAFPVTLMWGPEFVLVYNEAYAPLIANKHPAALGARSQDVFPEIWDVIGPMLVSVRAGGLTTWQENLRLDLERRGFLEECYFTFSYSAVSSPDGAVEGVIDIAEEATSQVLALRRLSLLRRLADELAEVDDPAEVRPKALPVLRGDPDDLPEADIVVADGPPAAPGGDLRLWQASRGSTVRLPLTVLPGSGRTAFLTVRLSPSLAVDEDYLGFLRLTASTLGQVIDRVLARDAERRLARLEREMSEALQRSLLTLPARTDGIELAVRYLPAVEQAYVGGDWYDSFTRADGAMTVVVGDVCGHDRRAAVAMAQIRNLLRGIASAVADPPGRLLSMLDATMHDLGLDTAATVLLAQLEPGDRPGWHTMRWSNAGHPRPILLTAAGVARELTTTPEILLGWGLGVRRADHLVELEPGATVVFYTDGLTERRDPAANRGPHALVDAVSGQQGLSAEQLCDHLLAVFDDIGGDDVALAVIRT